MSKFYSLILIYTHTFLIKCNDHNCERSNGMGTVLFTAADVHKQCWSPDEIAILTTRMILEDLLPDVTILNIDSNAFIDDIVDYCRLLIEVVKKNTHGRKKHITLLALTDLLGGYLRYAVLPIARHAFYAGHIDYTSMVRIIQLFEELKWFLRTNGQGWSKPIDSKPVLQIEPINFLKETPKGGRSCCERLIYYENEKKKKDNCTLPQTDVFFPLPFFDSKVRPSSIAVPFRRYALRNIESRKASYLLLKFFISAMQCMKDKKSSKEAIVKFQNNLFSWIEKEAMPKLNDDKFYAAFGGIMRVEETLKTLGAIKNSETTCASEGEEEMGAAPIAIPPKSSKSTIIIVVMLVTIILWFIIGTAFICYRIRRNQYKERPDKSSRQDYNTTSSGSSKWSLTRSFKSMTKSGGDSMSQTTKTTPYSSSLTSEYEADEKKGKKSKNQITVCYPPYASPYGKNNNKPAVIETKTTMKKLPSISEMSEISAIKPEGKSKPSKLPIGEPLYSSSREDVRKVSFSRRPSVEICPIPCPKHVGTSFSTSRTLTARGKDVGIQPSDEHIDECWCELYGEVEEEEYSRIAPEKANKSKVGKRDTTDHTKEKKLLKSILTPEDEWTPEDSDSIRDTTLKLENGERSRNGPNGERSLRNGQKVEGSMRNDQNGERSLRKDQNGERRNSQNGKRNILNGERNGKNGRNGRNGDRKTSSQDTSRQLTGVIDQKKTILEELEEEGDDLSEPIRNVTYTKPALPPSNDNKGVPLSSEFSGVENSAGEESATEKSAAENSVPENSVPDSTDDTGAGGPSGTSPHIYACHSSLTGAYATERRSTDNNRYIFGYDFQTSSSSDLTEEETDMKTSTSK